MVVKTASSGPIEVPAGITDKAGHPEWGSDLVLDVLRQLGIEFAAVLPGSTFRGVHDSAVNYTANRKPEFILCNHEMITVAMATGYARVTGRPMAAIVHNVVGLLNTTMTIYDAWLDRVPVLILGGTGPVDASRRRPWIDWIHTANVQGNLVRDFTKWDDQPASIPAMVESMLRAYRIAVTEPAGPVYVCLDVDLQEKELKDSYPVPDVSRYRAAAHPEPEGRALAEAATWLARAERPLCLVDRAGRNPATMPVLVELAELLAMPVIDLAGRNNFPMPHPLDFAGLENELLSEADVVLALDVMDLDGSLRLPVDQKTRLAQLAGDQRQRVISISLDELIHNGLTADYQALPAIDLPMLGDTGLAVPRLLELCRLLLDNGGRDRAEKRRESLRPRQEQLRAKQRQYVERSWEGAQISEQRLAVETWEAVKDEDFVFTMGRLRRLAPGYFQITRPDQYLGSGGGGAVGAGPGVALGAALALKGSGKLPVAFLGDGEFIASIQALWTAAHYQLPSVWIINNNRSYYNDEAHQDRVAQIRDRPPENRWIAMRIENPEVDLAAVARGFGVWAEGPVKQASDLAPALARAVAAAKAGQMAVLDVWTENRPLDRAFR